MSRLEDLAVVGNCQYSALLDRSGSVVWCCLPRFDAPPVFGHLLDPRGGAFRVGPADGSLGVQRYVENTNVVETTFTAPGGRFKVIDFAPRFELYQRMFRPTQLLRILEPLEGTPRLEVTCQPRLGWSRERPLEVQGSHHVSFGGFASELRLTTDLPLAYLGGQPFTLTGRRHLALTWGAPIEEPLAPLAARFLDETTRYWRTWVKNCSVPTRHQAQVIRSALALKLNCYEDTGAIIAAPTTSLPESPTGGRTWDYRYCWLRDAYYVLGAFHLLGQFEEREAFVRFLLDVAGATPDLALAPLYRIDGRTDLDERVVQGWAGYQGVGPVREGNAAARQRQHDIFGEMVLALTPIFMDERFSAERTPAVWSILERLGHRALETGGSPDAGIWELRSGDAPQTFSTLMSWAALDRLAGIARAAGRPGADAFAEGAQRLHELVVTRAWSRKLNGFAGTLGGDELDAALLQMAPLRFLPADDPRLHATVDATWRGLDDRGWLRRYRVDDGFGQPEVAFLLCTFWLVEALARLGRGPEAREVLDRVLRAVPPLGLLSEDYAPGEGRLWGNFPQGYSHVGLIHAAFAASPPWEAVL